MTEGAQTPRQYRGQLSDKKRPDQLSDKNNFDSPFKRAF